MSKLELKWDAVLYQKNSEIQFKLGQIAIERLRPRDGERILDIGCGNAMLTIDIAKQIPNGQVVGVEVSEEMYAQAQKNLQDANLSNITLVHQNALDIRFENEFDAVFSNSAIHWILDLERMYKIIYKTLKIQGRIVIQTGLKETNSLFGALSKTAQSEPFLPYLVNFKRPWNFLSVKDNEKILTKAGFQKILVEPYGFHMQFKTQEDMLNYCKAAAMVPFLALYPEEIKPTFENKFLEALLSLNRPNPLEMKMTRLFIQAEKSS